MTVPPDSQIAVRKLNDLGREVLRYWANLLEVTDLYVKVEATYDLPDNSLHGLIFRTGDRFVEWHYRDRWYNVFAIYDGSSQKLKGWYCNITRPAKFEDGVVSAEDLALDLLVYPDGRWEVLDEDEFELLDLSEADRDEVRSALRQLQRSAEQLREPFELD
jgi:predicted RNA-binding protein associated with RNAse of E/G family